MSSLELSEDEGVKKMDLKGKESPQFPPRPSTLSNNRNKLKNKSPLENLLTGK